MDLNNKKYSIMRLFKSFIGEYSSDFNERALKYGIAIPNTASSDEVDAAIKLYGINGEMLNNTFHKSFETVANTDIEILLRQQIMHYLTTYGFESLGIYDDKTIYIPAEKLEIPELNEDIRMIYIQPITEKQFSDILNQFVLSDIAFSEQTVNDIMELSSWINKDNFDDIKNREIKTALYDKYGVVPKNADEFVRYMIYKLTHSTLKIKNEAMFSALKQSDPKVVLQLLETYLVNTEKYNELSSVFYRNKMFFLALKGKDEKINSIINKLRKLADKNHKPLKVACLDNITNGHYDEKTICDALDKVTIFREIRVLNALCLYNSNPDYLGYKVRNGKMYISENETQKNLDRELNIVLNHLKRRIKDKISNKVFYIEDGVKLALPVSEKQFCAEYPEGTVIEIPKGDSIVFGVHWFNKEKSRVDLDLHLLDAYNRSYGWCTSFKNSKSTILYSGDMTSASKPNGASEMYYISPEEDNIFQINLNEYTSNNGVDYTFVVARDNTIDKHPAYSTCLKNYVINPNNVVLQFKNKIVEHSKSIGLVVIEDGCAKIILSNAGLGKTIVPNYKLSEQALSYLMSSFKTKITLNELIESCGGKIISTPTYMKLETDENGNKITKECSADYDFSAKSISKDTLISLFS